ncbi:N-carbamoylsarcosine amidase [Luminiphilus syltensis NOR5-1B]|uniref:N-carbamoylsarcosine amidase n=1 Tax=Luminiphilus syltensis NOR5-1B TaxID=565045 RepID=B8KY83_9GAMM|nr:isochorismatase family protein [Luminiphilus syltensis]EED34648.1 N-carbamoylsarcosine amidase [Luminiphilus syltensis NOR5-1B]
MRTLERSDQGLGAKPALVVIDVVNGFTDEQCPLGAKADTVVDANVALMNAFHDANLPVFLTTVIYRSPDQAQVFRARLPALECLTPDSHWVEYDPRLPIAETDISIEKVHASGFHGTDLDKQLRARGVDSLVVTGLTTSGCVRATVVDGLQNNYRVVVPEEAVGDRNPDAHAANLYDMNAKYADVLSLSKTLEALAALRQSAA